MILIDPRDGPFGMVHRDEGTCSPDRLHDALADLTDIVERVSRHEPTSGSVIDDAVARLRTAINEVRA